MEMRIQKAGRLILMLERVAMISQIVGEIVGQEWFRSGAETRTRFAAYMISIHAKGMVEPERLTSFCNCADGQKFPAWETHLPPEPCVLIVEDDAYLAHELKQFLIYNDIQQWALWPLVPTPFARLRHVRAGLDSIAGRAASAMRWFIPVLK